MNIDIKLHKNDLPEDLDLGNTIAIDGEFMGLNVRRDPLCVLQISSGNMDAHIIQLDRKVGEAVDIYVNNRLVARGEVVVVEDKLGITMTEIIKTEKAT